MSNKSEKMNKGSVDDGSDAGNDEMFSSDVMDSCNKMLENLSKNPNLINKTVKNFMQTFSGLQESVDDLTDVSSDSEKIDQLLVMLEETLMNSKRALARVIKLEKRLEKANLIKPSDD